ncbi:MAG: hypothetical protein R3C68_18115 [Myxococcota bacterium]
MIRTSAPTVGVLCGEGVSGGAVALSATDRLICLEHAYLCPTSPEAVSAILWRSDRHVVKASKLLRMTAVDLVELGLCTQIIDEGAGAHLFAEQTMARTKEAACQALDEIVGLAPEVRRHQRHQRIQCLASITRPTSAMPNGVTS